MPMNTTANIEAKLDRIIELLEEQNSRKGVKRVYYERTTFK